jgi:membrane protein DedA with SNARE-associated domain
MLVMTVKLWHLGYVIYLDDVLEDYLLESMMHDFGIWMGYILGHVVGDWVEYTMGHVVGKINHVVRH